MDAHREYDEKFSGRLLGVLDWDDFSALWNDLRARPEGWYVRDFKRRELPREPMPAEDFVHWLEETESFLRKRHRENYCGFLYLDDARGPTFMKIFDPRKMGSACGCGGAVEPRWTLSRARPTPPREEGGNGRDGERNGPLLRRLFGGG